MKDLVWSDAFVIPSNKGVASAGFSPLEIKSLLNSKDGITNLRGVNHYYCYDDNEPKVHTRAIFHPAYLLRNPIEKKRMWDDVLEIDYLISKNNIER